MNPIIRIFPDRILHVHIENGGLPYIWIGDIRTKAIYGFLSKRAMHKLYLILKDYFEKETK